MLNDSLKDYIIVENIQFTNLTIESNGNYQTSKALTLPSGYKTLTAKLVDSGVHTLLCFRCFTIGNTVCFGVANWHSAAVSNVNVTIDVFYIRNL